MRVFMWKVIVANVIVSATLERNTEAIVKKGKIINECVLNWSYNKTIQEQTLTIGSSVIPLSINDSTYSYSNIINDNISFTLKAKDERNKINPVQTNTTDSNYLFDNEDAIIVNFKNKKK